MTVIYVKLVGRTVEVLRPDFFSGRDNLTPHFRRCREVGHVLAGDCQVWVPDSLGGVAPHHAQIDRDRWGHWLRDIGSTGGTAVNGVWIDGKRRASLELGDTLWLGGVEIELLAEVTQLARVVPKAEKSRSVWKPAAWAERCRHLCRELGQAEIDVLLWFSRGLLEDREIGRALHRARDTVRAERISIYRKLDVHDRAELQTWLAHSTKSVPPGGYRELAR